MDVRIAVRAILLLSGLSAVQAFSSGAPPSTCLTMFPKHDAERQPTPCPYTFRLSHQTYRPLQEITVFVESPADMDFVGLQIRAHRVMGDTETIFGTFTDFPEDYLKPLSCYGGPNNMLSHKNAAKKQNLTLTWQAPDTPVGDLVFTATILLSAVEFWIDQKSTTLKDPSASNNLGNPEKVDNTEPKMDLEGTCGKTKGCFLYPRHCMGADCLAALSFQTTEGYVHFEMMGKAEGYISAGFSDDKLMGHDETVTCTAQDTRVTIQRGYNPAQYNERLYTVGLVNMATVQKDGYIYCKFSRPLVMSVTQVNYTSAPPTTVNHTFDLSMDWYLFLAWGYTYQDTDVAGHHTELPAVTADKVSLSSTTIYRGTILPVWLQIHATFAIVAWMLLVGLGTVIARHYRQGIGANMACGQKRWFQSHRFLVVLAACLTAASFILIFVQLGDWSRYVDTHAYLGIAIMAATVLQIFGGLIRPGPSSTTRPIFNWAHRILGKLTHIASAVEIYFAFEVKLFPESMRRFGFILVLVWIIAQILWEIALEVVSSCKSRSGSRNDYDVSKDFKLEEKKPEKTSRVANILLVLYTLTIVSITVAGLCAVLLF